MRDHAIDLDPQVAALRRESAAAGLPDATSLVLGLDPGIAAARAAMADASRATRPR